VFITWDQGSGPKASNTNYRSEDCTSNVGDVSCHVATFVVSPYTSPGTRSATYFNHYSLLRTTEELLGLPLLGGAGTAPSLRNDFGL
jgi:phosphatidylinositol-3-phosphatase